MEDKLYIVVNEVPSEKIIHYMSVSDVIGRFRLVNLNTYMLMPGSWGTIKELRDYFEKQSLEGKIIIEYDQELLRFVQ